MLSSLPYLTTHHLEHLPEMLPVSIQTPCLHQLFFGLITNPLFFSHCQSACSWTRKLAKAPFERRKGRINPFLSSKPTLSLQTPGLFFHAGCSIREKEYPHTGRYVKSYASKKNCVRFLRKADKRPFIDP
jgi:hypothetical protein